MALYRDSDVSPAVLLRTAVGCHTRPDHRPSEEGRRALVTPGCLSAGAADGSACCRLGHTAVVCGVRAELAVLAEACDGAAGGGGRRAGGGAVLPNLQYPALCHSRWRAGPPADRAQVDSARLREALCQSGAIDESALVLDCRDSGADTSSNNNNNSSGDEADCGGSVGVWVLHCDLVCLCDDGNVLEASVLALSAALRQLRLPTASFDRHTQQLHVTSAPRHQWRPLPRLHTHRLPVAVTVGLLQDSEQTDPRVLLDPCAVEEESGCQQLVTVWSDGQLLQLLKPGGVAVTQQLLARCLQLARARAEQLQQLLDSCQSTEQSDAKCV